MSPEAVGSAKGDPLRRRLASIEPASRGQDPSPARSRIRDTFDAMAAARKRGVTWAQITGLLAADGIKAADGEPLTVDEVRALFHAERQLRLSRQNRRTRPEASPPEPPAASSPPPSRPTGPRSPPSTEPPAPPAPAPTADPANPYAEVERRAAEAKRRREQVEAAKEWNPYETKEKPE